MSLPDYIYDFFVKINTGILSPLLKGLTYILPMLLILALVAGIIWLLFASRKGPAIFFVLVLLLANAGFGSLPKMVNVFNDWFGVSGTVDVTSATETYNNGFQEGANSVQGLN